MPGRSKLPTRRAFLGWWIAGLLGLLPDQFRRVLELRFLKGYSVREAAHEMGVTESNARVLQFRALRKAAELEGEVMG